MLDLAKLGNDIAAAKAAAILAGNVPDGGSCNLESAFFCLPKGVRSTTVMRAFESFGLRCYVSRWLGRGVMVTPPSDGQADKRYMANEAFVKSLQAAGWPVCCYYQMD